MKQRVVHRLVGYDRASERLAFELDIPPDKLDIIKEVAHVDPADIEVIGSYPLKDYEVRDIAAIAAFDLPPGQLDFFLESFAVGTEAYA
jgi:hypothetical protein